MTEQLNPLMLDTTTLTSGVGKLDTEITVEQIKDIGGVAITSMATFGEAGVFVIDSLNSKAEIIKFTDLEVLASGKVKLKNVERGMKPTGTLISDVSKYAKAHTVGAEVTLSNVPQFFTNFMKLGGDQTVSGDITFDGDVEYNGITSGAKNIQTNESVQSAITAVNAGEFESVIDMDMVAGENISADTIIRVKAADGKIYIADKDDATIEDGITYFGYSKSSVTAGATAVDGIVLIGETDKTGLSFGTLYLGNSGAYTTTEPSTHAIVIGKVLADGVLQMNSKAIRTNDIDARKGTHGTPSDTNRFETEEGLVSSFLERTLSPTNYDSLTASDTIVYSDSTDETYPNKYVWSTYSKSKDPMLQKEFQVIGKGDIRIKIDLKASLQSSDNDPTIANIFNNGVFITSISFSEGEDTEKISDISVNNFTNQISVIIENPTGNDGDAIFRGLKICYDLQ